MQKVDIEIGDFVYLKNYKALEKTHPSVINSLKQKYTYDNPKFLENEKYGRSNRNVPEYIRTYDTHKDDLIFYRGQYKNILRMLINFNLNYEVTKKLKKGRDLETFKTNIKLRPDQELAQNDALKHKQGLIISPTSFGKTILVLMLFRKIRKQTVIVVHTTELQKQWIQEAVEKVGVPREKIGGCGGIFQGKPRVGDLNICLYQTLSKEHIFEKFEKDTGFVVAEECQKTAVEAFSTCIIHFKALYRIGVSANHKRKDGMHFIVDDALGEVIHRAKNKASDSKILSFINIIETNYFDYEYDWDKDHTALVNRICEDDERNKLILNRCYQKYRLGKQVMIVVERKEQAFKLYGALSKKGLRVGVLAGNVSKKEAAKFNSNIAKKYAAGYNDKKAYEFIKKEAERKNLDVIIGTQKIEVGVSIRTIGHLIISSLVTSNIADRLNQIVGRAERTHGKDLEKEYGVKPTPTVDLLMDNKFKHIEANLKSVMRFYKGRVKVLKLRKK